MRPFGKRAVTAALTALGLAAAAATAAQAQALRVHTGGAGSSSFVFVTTMQSVVQKDTPYTMNVTAGQASTRSTLDASKGEVDFYVSAPAVNHFMMNGIAMYKEMSDAPELFKNVRGMVNFPLGPWHVMAFEDSGIKSLEDIRGRRVFIGPPGGAATTVSLAMIESATGMKPGDYDQAKLDWTSGTQAFQDRQVDLAIIPTELPSPSVQQFALLSQLRLLDIPQEAIDKEGPLKEMLKVPGRTIIEIPPDVYGDNQVNETPVKAVSSWVGIGTHKDVPEEVVYNVMKAIFDNLDTFHSQAEWMESFTPETALKQMNVALHPGAVRWYRENGIEVPEDLLPPEG